MRSSAPLLALATAALLLACNGSTNSPPKATLCPPGEVAGPGGTCILSDGGTGVTCTVPDAGTAVCDKPVGTSTAVTKLPLGTHQVGDIVLFTVPANTASVTIVEQAVSAPDSIVFKPSATACAFALDNTAVPFVVKDPTGAVVYDDNPPSPLPDPTTVPAFFASNSPATGTLTFPNTTKGLTQFATGVPAGQWSMTVSDFAYECSTLVFGAGQSCTGGSTTSSYDVTVITKATAGGGIPTAGGLNVNIYFATTKAPDQNSSTTTIPLSADSANLGNDPDLNRMVQTLKSILSNAGITVGTVTFKDLPPAVQAQYATGVDVDQTGACGQLSQLLKLSDPGNQLNIFFVSSFQATGLSAGNTVVGIDGTIPGPSTIGGTVASGAAVATHDLRAGRTNCTGGLSIACGADETAYIVAHETGHFLGLYHVTESEGTSFDPLTGTPPCPCSSCAPLASQKNCADASPAPAASSVYLVQVADCTKSATCGGGDNLMFWILDQGSQGTLLDEQTRVMRANPLIQ